MPTLKSCSDEDSRQKIQLQKSSTLDDEELKRENQNKLMKHLFDDYPKNKKSSDPEVSLSSLFDVVPSKKSENSLMKKPDSGSKFKISSIFDTSLKRNNTLVEDKISFKKVKTEKDTDNDAHVKIERANKHQTALYPPTGDFNGLENSGQMKIREFSVDSKRTPMNLPQNEQTQPTSNVMIDLSNQQTYANFKGENLFDHASTKNIKITQIDARSYQLQEKTSQRAHVATETQLHFPEQLDTLPVNNIQTENSLPLSQKAITNTITETSTNRPCSKIENAKRENLNQATESSERHQDDSYITSRKDKETIDSSTPLKGSTQREKEQKKSKKECHPRSQFITEDTEFFNGSSCLEGDFWEDELCLNKSITGTMSTKFARFEDSAVCRVNFFLIKNQHHITFHSILLFPSFPSKHGFLFF